MAQVARHAPRPSPTISRPAPEPAPAPPPTTPVARRPDTRRRSAQVKGGISGNVTHCQEASTYSPEKLRLPKSSGGTYSKPDARVKLIPAEEITYVQHRKPYCATVRSPGLQKRHCRRSITPPPSSRKVSIVPKPKRPDTAESRDTLVGGHITSEDHIGTEATPSSNSVCLPENEELLSPTSVFRQQSTLLYPDRIRTPAPILRKHTLPSQISLLSHQHDAKAGAPSKGVCTPENGNPCCTSCNRAARTTVAPAMQSSPVESALFNPTPALGEGSRELSVEGTRTAAAPIQKQSIVKHVLPSPMPLVTERSKDVYPNSKAGLKEAVVNHLSPSAKPVLAPCSSEDNLGTKAGPPSNSACTPENELHTTSCMLATTNISGPVLQSPVLESEQLSPITVLGEKPTEIYPDGNSTAAPTQQDPVGQHVLPSPTSLLNERSTEVYPNSSTGLCSSNNFLNKKIDMVSQQHKSIPQSHSLQSTAPAQCSTSFSCGASSELRHKRVQESATSTILHTKLHRKHYQSEAPWKGNFHVTGELKHTCDGLEAQFPFQIFVKVYEAAKKIPEVLKLEAVTLSQVWPKKFKVKPPDCQDIGLCFISSRQGPHRSFDHLLEKVSSNIGLWTNIGDTELSLFSSKLLPPDYQRKDGKLYFWGVFGKRLKRNQRHHNNHMSSMEYSNLSQLNEDSGDKAGDSVGKLHATEDKETESAQPEIGVTVDERGSEERDIDKAKGTPNSYPASSCVGPAASVLNGCCSHNTTNKSTFNVADFPRERANIATAASDLMLDKPNGHGVVLGNPSSDPGSSCAAPVDSLLSRYFGRDWNKSTFSLSDSLMQPADTSLVGPDLKLDTHPEFSLNVPPGFSKAHRRTEANDVPYVDAHPIVMDITDGFPNNIPPGFTEAHRGLPRITSTEPETGVSTLVTEKKPLIRFSLNVPRIVKTEALPGFATPNAAKKEPGSPAVDKATEKLTPSPLASGAPSVRKAGKADGKRITRDEVTEDDENSEPEFPKVRRLSELYGSPPEAEGQQEKQRNQGKRGMQEPPAESSLADTAKRLKVNGRLALSNGVDRQTNQDQ